MPLDCESKGCATSPVVAGRSSYNWMYFNSLFAPPLVKQQEKSHHNFGNNSTIFVHLPSVHRGCIRSKAERGSCALATAAMICNRCWL